VLPIGLSVVGQIRRLLISIASLEQKRKIEYRVDILWRGLQRTDYIPIWN
jgi:hypothetical protein